MKLKKRIASLMACSMLLAAAPVEAMAYETPGVHVRDGLVRDPRHFHGQDYGSQRGPRISRADARGRVV